jgi:hypothetical protein
LIKTRFDESKQQHMLPKYNIKDEFQQYIKPNSTINKLKLLNDNQPGDRVFYRIIWYEFLKFLNLRCTAYIHRDNLVNDLIEQVKLFVSRYNKQTRVFAKSKKSSSPDNCENFYRKIYGGTQCHILSAYHDNTDELNFFYGKGNNLEPQSQPVLRHQGFSILSQINNLKAFSLEANANDVAYAICSPNCAIPKLWGTKINKFLSQLNNAKCFNSIQRILIMAESCNICKGLYNKCPDLDQCTVLFYFINCTAAHYQHLRSIIRKLYLIRSLNLAIINVNNDIANGKYAAYQSRAKNNGEKLNKEQTPKTNSIVPIKRITLTNEFQIDTYADIISQFEKDILIKLDLKCCDACKKLYQRRYLTKLSGKSFNDTQKTIIQQLVIECETAQMCRLNCFKDLTVDRPPKYSSLNNMKMDPTPKEIAHLNFFERMLICKGKVFQTIIRLRGKSRNPKFNGVPALKGLAVHLPLTFAETNQYVVQTLPNYNALNIIISSLPTKTNNVWRLLINLDKVYTAINWLCANNRQYGNIVITKQTNLPLYGLCYFSKNDDTELDAPDANLPSYLHMDSDGQSLKHVTVVDLDKHNYNDSDINKYTCKKVEGNIMNNNDADLDHICIRYIPVWNIWDVL